MSAHRVIGLIIAIFVVVAGSRAFAEDAATQPGEASFSYAGNVFDQQGHPLAGVRVAATYHALDEKFMGYIGNATTDGKGHFAIDRAVALSGATMSVMAGSIVRLEFHDKNHAFAKLEDLQLLNRDALTHLSITLQDGRSLKGRILDPNHEPVIGVPVEMTFGDKYDYRRAQLTDTQGRFELHGLPTMDGELEILTVDANQPMLTGTAKIKATQTDAADVTLAEIKLPADVVVHELLGMKLADVNADLQALFHLPSATGVLVIDPGSASGHLQIGQLQRGDQFWLVRDTRIKDFAEFKSALAEGAAADKDAHHGVRVVYNFKHTDFAGSNTQYLKLSAAEIKTLSE